MEHSCVTSNYFTAVPAGFRVALGVRAGDKIGWEIAGHTATVVRIASEKNAWNVMIEANLAVQ